MPTEEVWAENWFLWHLKRNNYPDDKNNYYKTGSENYPETFTFVFYYWSPARMLENQIMPLKLMDYYTL